MSSFKIYTFGCKVNFYESEAIKEKLIAKGLFESINDKADYFIVNTCAVTSNGERKCLQTVRRISRNNPNSKIGVVGCSSQISKAKYLEIPNVHAICGNSNKSQIVENILREEASDCTKLSIRHEEYDVQIIEHFGHEVRAFCKIQDGCDNFCTYCVIPQTRGNSRSRPLESILDEINILISNGYKEVVLTGIDMGSYFYESKNFDDLLESILKKFDGLVRIRIGSLEESQITDRTIAMFSLYSKTLVPHLHIPLQSGSETILKAMHRKYELNSFLELTAKLKRHLPYIALSTDVIIGFPGESEENFMETYNFTKEVGFMRLHVFPYSPRPHTLAATLKNQVSVNVKNERVNRLITLGNKLQEEYIQANKDRVMQLLIEEKTSEGKYKGYTENYLEYEVESDEDIYRQIVEIKLDNNLNPYLV